jgi:hypothetical protein
MTDPTPEPTPSCPCCARPNDDRTWRVCDHDRDNVDRWLTEIEMLHQLVACAPLNYLLPGATTGDAPIGGHREPPLPLDLAALDLLTAESVLRGMDADDMGLEDWVVDWRHWLGHAGHGQATERDRSPAETLSGVIRYLRSNWPLMARSAADGGHPAVDEWYADVRAIRGRAWAALRLIPSDLDQDVEPPPDYVLECPTDDCHNRIPMTRTPRPIDGEKPEPVSVSCNRCGARWTTPRLLLVAAVSGTRVEITVDDAATHYGVTAATVRRMVQRGELHRGRRGYVVMGGQEAMG